MAVQQQLESILEMDPRPIVDHLQKSAPLDHFFTDLIASLPLVDVNAGGVMSRIREGGATESLYTLELDPIGRGAMSVILKTNANDVFKKIVFPKITESSKLELSIRSVFLELFIQTVLSLDSYVGNSICKVIKLYRSEDAANHILYLQIEYIDTPFDIELQKYKKAGESKVNVVSLLPMFLQLQQILEYLQTTYSFQHHDLHYKNVMFSKDFIKIIDFGMSTLTWNGVLYALPTNRDNPSYDLYLFFASILTWLSEAFSKEDGKFITSLFYNPNADEGKEDYYDFYTYVQEVLDGEEGEETTDHFYADAIAVWSRTAVEILGPFPSSTTVLKLIRKILSKRLVKCSVAGGFRKTKKTKRGGRRTKYRRHSRKKLMN